jgi:ribosomal protein L32
VPQPDRTPSAATKLDDKRPPCSCKPWAQRWKAVSPERCANCGGMFQAHTVEARRPRPGEVIPNG